MGPIAPVYVGNSVLSLVTKTKLLGLIVDQKLTWVANVLETENLGQKNGLSQIFLFFYQEEF